MARSFNCKEKINEYVLMYPEITKYYLDLSVISNQLCLLDNNFPPVNLWIEYYNVEHLSNIIILIQKKKRTINI